MARITRTISTLVLCLPLAAAGQPLTLDAALATSELSLVRERLAADLAALRLLRAAGLS